MLIPLWAFITLQSIAGLLALLALTLIARAWLRRKELHTRRCYRCHYDLSATSGLKCPECGREAKSESELLGKRRRWRSTRRAVVPLIIASLACFSAFAAAWPTRAMPNWLLVSSARWMSTLGQRASEVVDDDLRHHRFLSRDELAKLTHSIIKGLYADPIDSGTDRLLVTLCSLPGDPISGTTMPIEQGSHPYVKLAIESLLSDDDAIALIEAASSADQRSQSMFDRTTFLSFRVTKGGKQRTRWLTDRVFAPTADWALLYYAVYCSTRESGQLLSEAIVKFDQGSQPERLRAAFIIRMCESPLCAMTAPSTPEDETIARRGGQILSDMHTLNDLCRQLLADLMKGLDSPSIDEQLLTCRAARAVAIEPQSQQTLDKLRALQATSTDARVRQVAASALSKMVNVRSESIEAASAAPAPPPPSPR